jgi:hypothetical protein
MKYKVGDKVRAINGGGTFSTYDNFFKENGLEKFKEFWAECKELPVGDYTVVATGKHSKPRQYGTLYLLRNEEGKIYISNNDRGCLTLVESKGEGKMKACKLMVDALENPQKYGGKKYKVVAGACVSPAGKKYFEIVVDANGILQGNDYDNWAYVSGHAELEEIPQPVPFMEAVKAAIEGRHPIITLDGMKLTLLAEESSANKIGHWLKARSVVGATINISTKMVDGLWTIEE